MDPTGQAHQNVPYAACLEAAKKDPFPGRGTGPFLRPLTVDS